MDKLRNFVKRSLATRAQGIVSLFSKREQQNTPFPGNAGASTNFPQSPTRDEKADRQKRLTDQALQALDAGRHAEAEHQFRQVLELAPKAPRTTFLLGCLLLQQKRYREGRLLIERAYEIRPWVNDSISWLELRAAVAEAAREYPDWLWPRYQLARDKYVGVEVNLARALSELKKRAPIFFIQVGANVGRGGDPVFHQVRPLNMKGLLVEPQPACFEQLQENYKDVEGLSFEKAAITTENCELKMYSISEKSTLASLSPDRNYLRERSDRVEFAVPGITFDTLVSKHNIDQFSFLQIDTEGHDYQILKQIDLTKHGVQIVNIEFECLPLEERLLAFEHLEKHGFAYFVTERDLLCLKRESFDAPFYIGVSSPENAR